jgi:hypothetical protein
MKSEEQMVVFWSLSLRRFSVSPLPPQGTEIKVLYIGKD